MVPSQNTKLLLTTPPEAIRDNSSWGTAEIDTIGFDYCTIIFMLGATDIGITALKVQESDTSGSGFADVSGLIWGTSANIAGATSTLPSATDDNKIFIFEINLKGRKRYLDVVATIGDGTVGGFATILTELSRAEEAPKNAAGRGAKEILRV